MMDADGLMQFRRMFLGVMGVMTGDPRSATVIVQFEVLAYRLDKEKSWINAPSLLWKSVIFW